ncbi:hypothetical protein, partial [Microcoleus sp. PH2017_01_SCD_O_A]|uniref:hypothetical protein n=1 Tax=Microcoleus sp. PH2017_01_SCD_O_A TaxID=2798812 RepID=UPI0025D54C21
GIIYLFVGYDSHAFHPPLTEYAIVGEFPSALLKPSDRQNDVKNRHGDCCHARSQLSTSAL